jgi:ParB-like chromosome segregation protein Spo0J
MPTAAANRRRAEGAEGADEHVPSDTLPRSHAWRRAELCAKRDLAGRVFGDAMKAGVQNESSTEMRKTKTKKSVKFGSQSHDRRKSKPADDAVRTRVAKDSASSPNETGSTYKVRHFKLADIKAKKPHGPIDPEVVERIVEGYRTHGQLMPLTVRVINKVPHLEVGFHRRAAAEKLGLKVVPCNVIRGKTVAALWRISENRDRKILSVLDQAEQMAEWFHLVEEMNPVSEEAETRGPGRPEGAKKKAARYLPIPGKTQAAKEKALDRLLKIAAIDPVARLAARDAGLADSGQKLLQIADEPTAKAQLAKIKAPPKRSGKTGSDTSDDHADEAEPPLVVLKRVWKTTKDLQAAWKRASLDDRRAFIVEDLKYPLDEEPEGDDEERDDGDDEDGDDEASYYDN